VLAALASATISGVEGRPVRVEVHVSNGLPGFAIVGLPDASCREARDRVRAALLSSGLEFPLRRITVNLAPSDLRKAGTGLDLAIAVGVLVASGQLDASVLDGRGFLGELGLDGSLRAVPGVLPMALAVDGVAELVVPAASAAEAQLVGRHVVRPLRRLSELVEVVAEGAPWPSPPPERSPERPPTPPADLADVRGQAVARRALEVAAAGGHHLLMVGPPGGGKTMLAERLPGLLGDLDDGAALAVTATHSAAGQPLPPGRLIRTRPFRAPHHSSSLVSMVGGGSAALRPGEISLASGGVLFLDELGEFPASVLDALRQPLEQGRVRVSRAHGAADLPARFVLVAAMNPCPCGYAPGPSCRCTEVGLARYARRVSGPILDRLDLRVVVQPPTRAELLELPPGEPSAAVAARVAAARERAAARGVGANVELGSAALDEWARFDHDGRRLVERALDAGRLTGRGLARVRAVALTLDDLRGGPGLLDEEVVAEALALRADLDFLHHVAVAR
jgi:magnesium chelatase family protein